MYNVWVFNVYLERSEDAVSPVASVLLSCKHMTSEFGCNCITLKFIDTITFCIVATNKNVC